MNRAKNAKLVLWILAGFAAAVALNRYLFGLGVTTNLNDRTPWGFWIGFDVMAGVALAAGGFVTTAVFYIMKREEFHPLVKPAVLTAFLGYVAVVVGLLFDLGLPWNIWHMIIYWNPHSPLFEVGWCVMLYTSVLLLEFSPVPLEEYSRYAKIRNFLMKYRFVLVLLGIMLSTLHQSSLGSLFLIMPERLYPLWYTHILPIEFFISAVALGLMMVAFETLVSHWLYRRDPETVLVGKLCRVAAWVLALYFVVKSFDLGITGKLGLVFNGKWQSDLFIVEIAVSTIIPAVMFAVPRLTRKPVVQWTGSFMVVAGMVLNRIDVGGLAMYDSTASYTPSWMEIAISLGVVSAACLVFLFVLERFNIWEIKPADPESMPQTAPSFDYSSRSWLGTPDAASLARHSLAFVLSFALGMGMMSGKRLHAEGVDSIRVSPATGIDTLCINGNRDDQYVEFSHEGHIAWLRTHAISLTIDGVVHTASPSGGDSCTFCHHLNLPGEKVSNCAECHTSMYSEVDFFRHGWHASAVGANLKCDDCHATGVTRNAASAKKCTACHRGYDFAPGKGAAGPELYIPSYVDAMHKLCVSCHIADLREVSSLSQTNGGILSGKDKSNLAQCASCHRTGVPPELRADMKWQVKLPHYDNVVLPNVGVTVK